MWAALFPGQGSQQIGMGKFLYENFSHAKDTFEEASDTLKLNFKELCFTGPDTDLALTENTQPALLLVSTATYRVLQANTGVKIAAGSGHSIGEYAACVTSGALAFTDALRAVRLRGQAMQRAVPVGHGAMAAALGMTDDQVIQLCKWVQSKSGEVLEPANFNSPGQVVISGSAKAVDWLNANVTAASEVFGAQPPKIRLIPLKVSAPFHCSLMKPAEEEMRKVLTDTKFQNASWPIVQNFTAQETQDAEVLRKNLISQVSGAVRWTQCFQRLGSMGVTRAIEFGSGKVLSGLAKKIDSVSIATFNINSLEDLKNLENLG